MAGFVTELGLRSTVGSASPNRINEPFRATTALGALFCSVVVPAFINTAIVLFPSCFAVARTVRYRRQPRGTKNRRHASLHKASHN